jgi:hypothetical protein
MNFRTVVSAGIVVPFSNLGKKAVPVSNFCFDLYTYQSINQCAYSVERMHTAIANVHVSFITGNRNTQLKERYSLLKINYRNMKLYYYLSFKTSLLIRPS